GDQFKWSPVGTGPFSFERHSPRDKIVLKAFDKFYGGRPQIDEVHWYDVPEDATKLIGLEKGTFDLLYPEAVTADFADQVKKMGAVIDRRGPGGREEAPGRGGPPERLHDQELLHQQVVLLSEGAHPGPGAAPEGRHHRRAPGRRPRDLPREHPEEPRPLRALRRYPHHRRRSV